MDDCDYCFGYWGDHGGGEYQGLPKEPVPWKPKRALVTVCDIHMYCIYPTTWRADGVADAAIRLRAARPQG